MKNFLKLTFLFSFLTVQMACNADFTGITDSPQADNSVIVKDGGTYNPANTGQSDVCVQDNEGACIDEVAPTEIVYLNDVNFNFGLSEIGNVECIELDMPAGMVYQAEIDKSVSNSGESTTSFDSQNLYLFAPKVGDSDATQERTPLSQGDANLCYLRTEAGQHHGSIIISFKHPSSSDWQYVISTNLTGETGEDPFWNIQAPLDGSVYDERSGYNDGLDESEGDILVDALGSISETYHNILKDGLNTPVFIKSDTLNYEIALSDSGEFSQSIALPQVPGVYAVEFSIDTTRNTTITKTHKVIVADAPDIDIVVLNESGNAVSSTLPTDLQNLIVGVRVNNLQVSGVNRNLEIFDIYIDNTQIAGSIPMYYEDGSSWCNADSTLPSQSESSNYTGFSAWNTYCFKMSDITDISNGTHVITAKAKNDLGTADASFTLIADYDKPIITIDSPDNLIVNPNDETLTLTGTIQNFASHNLNQAPDADENATGSYCIPTEGSPCEGDSLFKLWFNSHTSTNPIHIYPKYDAAYDGLTSQEINNLISENTPEQCRDFSDSTSHFSGDSQNTNILNNNTIKTTVVTVNTDESETTTVYETTSDGKITRTIDGTTEVIFEFIETETNSKTVHVSEDGTITTEVYDAANDETLTFVTSGRTGAISESSSQKRCNIPLAHFSLTFSLDEVPTNLFTNLLEFRAESISGHRTIKIYPFVRGYSKMQTAVGTTDLKTVSTSLGTKDQECTTGSCVKRSPLMLHISEGILNKNTLEGKKIIKAVEYILNTEMPFENLANGIPAEDDDGNIDLYAKFRKQYENETGGDEFPEEFYQLSDTYRKKFIYQGLHSAAMVDKALALKNYRVYLISKGLCDRGNSQFCFFENTGDPLATNLSQAYNVAKDSCDKTITTSFTPLHHHIYLNQVSSNNEAVVYGSSTWPLDLAGTDVHFNDFISGKWVVESLDLQSGGKISADVCVLPNESQYTSCNDDVSQANLPAFWGHFTAYNLIEDGLLQTPGVNDLTGSFIWSVGKIRIKLDDVLQIVKTENGETRLDINANNIDATVKSYFDISRNETSSIILEPFQNCRTHYKKLWETQRDKLGYSTHIDEDQYPLGCPAEGDNRLSTYPILLETNTAQADELMRWAMDNGKSSSYILGMIWDGVVETFSKMIGCADTEALDPMLKIKNENYPDEINPPFVYPEKFLSQSDTDEDDVKFTLTEIEWQDLKLNLDIKNSDLIVKDGGITAKLIISPSVENVDWSNQNSNSSSNQNIAFKNGPIARSLWQGNLDDYPLMPQDLNTASFMSSINIEETLNDALYLLFKKGPFSWMEALGLEDLETNGSNEAIINSVVLANAFDICGDIAGGVLSTNLPTSLFFPEASSVFETSSMSVKLILDQDNPPTFSLSPYEFTQIEGQEIDIQDGHAVELKIGITNLQAGFHEFIEEDTNEFRIGDEILRLRLDAVLSFVIVYHPDDKKMYGFFPQNQNYHVSVVPGHNAGLYDDVAITSDLSALLSTVLAKIEKNVLSTANDDEKATLVLNFEGPENDYLTAENPNTISVTSFDNFEVVFNMDQATNGECEDGSKPQYYENRRRSGNFTNHNRRFSFQKRNRVSRQNRQPIHHHITHFEQIIPPETIEPNSPLIPGTTNSDCAPFWNSEDENPLDVMLCEYGIDDIYITPRIIFDTENGYIHLGGDLMLKLESWLEDEL